MLPHDNWEYQMGPRFDRKTLEKADPKSLIRFGKYLKVKVPPDDCICPKCNSRLIELITRQFEFQDSWPPRLLERRW